jgi:GNAT superfamily N-acetyltransferase
MSRTTINVRPVEPSDLEAIMRIDEKLSGQTRKDYWRQRLDITALRPPWMSLLAETDGRPVGFLFGWVSESEFGIGRPTGWVDLIGVDPPYRGRGVADQGLAACRSKWLLECAGGRGSARNGLQRSGSAEKMSL